MNVNVVIAPLVVFCIVGGIAAPNVYGADPTDQLLEKAEVQLRAIYETGELFRKSPVLRLCHALPNYMLAPLLTPTMDNILHKRKLSNLAHEDNKYVSVGVT